MNYRSSHMHGKKAQCPSFYIVLLVIALSSILAVACGDPTVIGNTVASNNNVCPLSFISCNDVNFNINLNVLPLHLYITDSGTTVCDSNMKVNGSEANKSQDSKLGTIIIYRGSGGKLIANSKPVHCFNFPNGTNQQVINTFVTALSTGMKAIGCGNNLCIDGVKEYTFGH